MPDDRVSSRTWSGGGGGGGGGGVGFWYQHAVPDAVAISHRPTGKCGARVSRPVQTCPDVPRQVLPIICIQKKTPTNCSARRVFPASFLLKTFVALTGA